MALAVEQTFERLTLEKNKDLVAKWKPFIEAPNAPPVTSDYDRAVLARWLENTEAAVRTEALQTTTAFGTAYQKAMLGLTRQVFPRLFGRELVATQAMDRPTGSLFHLTTARDDNSTLGVNQQGDASGIDYTAMQASRTYADHANGEGGAIAKGVKLTLTQQDVTIAKVKKLKTDASWELQTDLQNVHGLSAIDILQSAAVDEIAQEIDAMITRAVRDAAVAAGTTTFGQVAPAGYTAEEWRHRLQRAILIAHKNIYASTYRHPNVMVCGLDAWLELQDLNGFKAAPNADWATSTYGVFPVGTLNGLYRVMVSRNIPDKEIILGFRGAGMLDGGVVFAPYVGLFISDRFFDVDTQKTTQSFASRFDIFTLSNKLYRRVLIDSAATGIS